jgi:hypothetical protein
MKQKTLPLSIVIVLGVCSGFDKPRIETTLDDFVNELLYYIVLR